MTKQNIKRAKLFTCARCEWLFKTPYNGCPKYHSGYYSAHYVYGNKAYTYYKTQEPWKTKLLAYYYEAELCKEIATTSEYNRKKVTNHNNLLNF